MKKELDRFRNWALKIEEQIDSFSDETGVQDFSDCIDSIKVKEVSPGILSKKELEEALVMTKFLKEKLLVHLIKNTNYIKTINFNGFDKFKESSEKWEFDELAVKFFRKEKSPEMVLTLSNDVSFSLPLSDLYFNEIVKFANERFAQSIDVSPNDCQILFAVMGAGDIRDSCLKRYANDISKPNHKFDGWPWVMEILKEYYPVKPGELEHMVYNCGDFDDLRAWFGMDSRKSSNPEIAKRWDVKKEWLGKWVRDNILVDPGIDLFNAYKYFGSFDENTDEMVRDYLKKQLFAGSNEEFLDVLWKYKGKPDLNLSDKQWDLLFARFQRQWLDKPQFIHTDNYSGLLYLSNNSEQRNKVFDFYRGKCSNTYESKIKYHGEILINFYEHRDVHEMNNQIFRYLRFLENYIVTNGDNKEILRYTNEYLDDICRHKPNNQVIKAISERRGEYTHLNINKESKEFKSAWNAFNDICNQKFTDSVEAFLSKADSFDKLNKKFGDDIFLRGKIYEAKCLVISDLCDVLKNENCRNKISSIEYHSENPNTCSLDFLRGDDDFISIYFEDKKFNLSFHDIEVVNLKDNINDVLKSFYGSTCDLQKNNKIFKWVGDEKVPCFAPDIFRYGDINNLFSQIVNDDSSHSSQWVDSVKDYKENHKGYFGIKDDVKMKFIQSNKFTTQEIIFALSETNVNDYECKLDFMLYPAHEEALWKRCNSLEDKILFINSRDNANIIYQDKVSKEIRNKLGECLFNTRKDDELDIIVKNYEGKPPVIIGDKGLQSVLNGLQHFTFDKYSCLEKLSYFNYKMDTDAKLYDIANKLLNANWGYNDIQSQTDIFEQLDESCERFDNPDITSLLAHHAIEIGNQNYFNRDEAVYFKNKLENSDSLFWKELRKEFGISEKEKVSLSIESFGSTNDKNNSSVILENSISDLEKEVMDFNASNWTLRTLVEMNYLDRDPFQMSK